MTRARPTTLPPTNNHPERRGQAYILEGVLALLIIAGAVFAVVPAIGMAPFTETPDDVRKNAEIERDATGLLEASSADGTLKATVLAWNPDEATFQDGSGTPTAGATGQWLRYPDTGFGNRVRAFAAYHDVRVNVALTPMYNNTTAGEQEPMSKEDPTMMIQTGSPSTNTVTVTTLVPLYNNDRFRSPASAHSSLTSPPEVKAGSGDTLGEQTPDNYPIRPGAGNIESSSLYNMVEVELVIWYDL